MLHKIRVAAATTLALSALTGCGEATADASAHVYEPLPSLSTATPTKSPAPQPTSRPAPTSSPTPSATPAAPSPDVAGSAGAGTAAAAPVQAPATAAAAPVAAPVAAAPVAVAPAPVATAQAPVAAAPVQVTETVSTTTSSVTSTTLEARIMIVVTCEGWCVLGDLAAPELTGADGPISSASIRDLLEAERHGGDEQKLTEELIESLAKDDWDLLEQQSRSGQEKFVFTSAAGRK